MTELKGIWNAKLTFLYPKQGRTCRIPICRNIVLALQERDFKVPGVEIEFHLYGPGTKKFKTVYSVKYEGICIEYLFIQGLVMTNLNDTAGLHRCYVPSLGTVTFDDGSGTKVTETQITQFEKALGPLLSCIESTPTTSLREFTNALCESQVEYERNTYEPYPSSYPTLYVDKNPFYCLKMVEHYQIPFNELKEEDRTIHLTDGWMVDTVCIPSDVKVRMHPLALSYSFAKCFLEQTYKEKINKYKNWKWDDRVVAAIRPHYLDRVYVRDLTEANNYRKKCFETVERLSSAQYERYVALTAVTVVSMKQYMEEKMNFETPEYLIQMPIGYDEVVELDHVTTNGIIHYTQK